MTSDTNTKTLERGEVINETYKVDFFIGEGAFGEVYRVKHKFFNDFQVMKVLKSKCVNDTNFDELVNEGRILAKLTHPNIVRVFDVNTFKKNSKQYIFITMGFVSGESLAQLLKRKIRIPVPEALSIMVDVLNGLNIAHSHKPTIVHRDINLDNILLSYESDKPVGLLCDFGISVLLDQVSELAGAGGRYLYFAPECFMNCYLPSSDIFSAGIVFYKMITGVQPWNYDFEKYKLNDKGDIEKMIHSGRKEACKKPSLFNSEISQKLDYIILTSLENNMEKRYRTAGEFLEGLKNL